MMVYYSALFARDDAAESTGPLLDVQNLVNNPNLVGMSDEQRRSHAMQQLRAARELYSETGEAAYLSVIDAHLRTIAEVDTRRRISEARRAALLELRRQEGDQTEPEPEPDPEARPPGRNFFEDRPELRLWRLENIQVASPPLDEEKDQEEED